MSRWWQVIFSLLLDDWSYWTIPYRQQQQQSQFLSFGHRFSFNSGDFNELFFSPSAAVNQEMESS
jgi:hypothetical protein